MSNVIEIEGLRKDYRRLRGGRIVAVSGLDLAVPAGGVFGFLGPNGSGKTTTMRCLLGLVRPTAGRMSLLGAPVPAGLATTIRRVGAVVEVPALFPTMSARENLTLLGAIDGIGRQCVDQVLELVGLAERARDPVRRYSLGMRQRLGLAAALLKDPELLILDEPANGLDPAGIKDTRRLLRQLASEGRTVFLSSHLLAEVEQICDTVAILSQGRSIVTGTVKEVLATAQPASTLVGLDDLEAGAAVLRRAGLSVTRDDRHLRVAVHPDEAASVTRLLAAADLWVSELKAEEATLEDLFLELTTRTEDTRKEAA